MAKRWVATTGRLTRRVAHVLREHPPPVGGDHLQIPLLGIQRAQELELLDRLADPADRAGLLTKLLDRRGRATSGHDEQLVECALESGCQQSGSDTAVDLVLGVGPGRGDEPLEHRQPGKQQSVSAQPVDGAAQQRQRPIMAERPVAQPRPQRVEIAVAAAAKGADAHRLREVLGAGVALGVQARRCDRRERNVQLTCDQRGGRLRQLIECGRDEAQPAQRADRNGNREAPMNIAVRRDLLELVVGEGEERCERCGVDLLREALPLCALAGGQDLDGHQNSISRSDTAF